MELNAHALTQTSVKEFLDILAEKDKKAEKTFLASKKIKKIIAKKSTKPKHPIEALVEEHLIISSEYSEVLKVIKKGINYLNSEQVCDVKVLAFVVSEYMKLHDPDRVRCISQYKDFCIAYELVPMADKIAAELDKEQLQEVLMKLAFKNDMHPKS